MKVQLYAHALRVARPRQLRARALEPINRRRFPRPAGARAFHGPSAAEAFWRSPAFANVDDILRAGGPEEAGPRNGGPDVEGLRGDGLRDGRLRVLGRDIDFPPQDWSLPGEPRLRRFHLHYGDEVLAWARRGDEARARQGLRAWIDANPPAPADAWHPYVVSTRAGNWIAAFTLLPALADGAAVESLRLQLASLARNVEDAVLGNHVVRNARALVLGGIALGDRGLRRQGESLLRRELGEQVLSDGGHYERSPVYHLAVLRDLLELRAAGAIDWVDEPIAAMERFSAALACPDGSPALFNDAPLDLAPTLELPEAAEGLSIFPDTGYVVVRDGPLWLAFDCGAPAPPFLPAHAHSDALSVQAWFAGRPVLVDAGTFTYEPGAERDWFRGSRAHSTVAVAGLDQFELWGAFRAGKLPEVRLTGAGASGLTAVAAYRGIRHERSVRWDGSRILIDDSVSGRVPGTVESRLILAPGATVEPQASGAVEQAGGEPGWLSRRFFERTPAEVRVARSPVQGPSELSWSVELAGVRRVPT